MSKIMGEKIEHPLIFQLLTVSTAYHFLTYDFFNKMPWSSKKKSFKKKFVKRKTSYKKKSFKKAPFKKRKIAFKKKAGYRKKSTKKGKADIAGAMAINDAVKAGTLDASLASGAALDMARSSMSRSSQTILKYHGKVSPFPNRWLTKVRATMDGAFIGAEGGTNALVVVGNDILEPFPYAATGRNASYVSQLGSLYSNFVVHGSKLKISVDCDPAEVHVDKIIMYATIIPRGSSIWANNIPKSVSGFNQFPGIWKSIDITPVMGRMPIKSLSMYIKTKDMFSLQALDDTFYGTLPSLQGGAGAPATGSQWFFGVTAFDATGQDIVSNLPVAAVVIDYDVEIFNPTKDANDGQPTTPSIEDDFTDMSMDDTKSTKEAPPSYLKRANAMVMPRSRAATPTARH